MPESYEVEMMSAFYVAEELSRVPENRRVATIVRTMGISNAAIASQVILSGARTGSEPVTDASAVAEVSSGYGALVAATAEPTETCFTCCGEQEVVSYGSGPGYAGGGVYWSELACGHTNLDETADSYAAR